ncbi:caspase family protein [Larkinella punicea]|nr:caspase family protein [Larkinella punicea]
MKKILLLLGGLTVHFLAGAQSPTVVSAKSQPLKLKGEAPKNLPPVITWQSPGTDYVQVKQPAFTVSACVQSFEALKEHQVLVNGKTFGQQRGMKRLVCGEQVSQEVLLQVGDNVLQITATNSAGTTTSTVRHIVYEAKKDTVIGQKRVALIVANSDYEKHPLKNPVNDGRSVREQFEKLGFTVTLVENLKLRETDQALEKFYSELDSNNVGLFYYAGHGIMADNQNFIQPTDADPSTEVDARYVCYSLERVVARMKTANPNGSNLVFWDACRNNPYRSWTRGTGQPVYTTINPPVGTLIVYATEPGKTASDGNEKNGLFTSELVKSIEEPNLDIFELIDRIDQGLEKRGFRQPPYIEGRLRGKLILNPVIKP